MASAAEGQIIGDAMHVAHRAREAMYMAERKVLIIMPAHNEAENLPRVFEELQRVFETLHPILPYIDVVVVDDYSSDDTAMVAARLGAEVVTLPCNLGYGGAVQTGFKYAVERGYDYAVMMDSDGQHDPAYIPDLLAPVLAGEVDVTIGSRFLQTDGSGRVAQYRTTWAKRLGMTIFAAIVAHFSHRPVSDPTSGFQAMNHDLLAFFARDNYPSDYPDADTLLLLNYAGFRVAEVPVCMHERLAGVSMHTSWKVFYYIFKMFLSIFIVLLRQSTHGNARRRRTSAQTTSVSREGLADQ
jgi:glycosyltransferase involved in cell wall biosynthesis